MTDETISGASKDATILNKGNPILISLKCAADYPKPGHLVAQKAASTAGVAEIADMSDGTALTLTYGTAGIALETPDLDVDTAFVLNAPIRIARLGSDCVCWSFMDSSIARRVYIGTSEFLGASVCGAWGPIGASFVSITGTNE